MNQLLIERWNAAVQDTGPYAASDLVKWASKQTFTATDYHIMQVNA